MGSGWFWGCGVNLATWVLRGEVARNQTAAFRTVPAAVGADVVAGDSGDDVPDRERPVHTGSGFIALGDGGRFVTVERREQDRSQPTLVAGGPIC